MVARPAKHMTMCILCSMSRTFSLCFFIDNALWSLVILEPMNNNIFGGMIATASILSSLKQYISPGLPHQLPHSTLLSPMDATFNGHTLRSDNTDLESCHGADSSIFLDMTLMGTDSRGPLFFEGSQEDRTKYHSTNCSGPFEGPPDGGGGQVFFTPNEPLTQSPKQKKCGESPRMVVPAHVSVISKRDI